MTNPLGTALRNLGDASDPRRLPPPGAVRAGGDRRRRRTTARRMVLAALVCSLLVLVRTTWDSSDPDAQPAVPAPGRTSTPQAERTTSGSPPYPIQRGPQRFSAQAIAAREGRFVVVGDSSDAFDDPGPAVFWSDNGVDWQAPSTRDRPDSVNVADVIATPEGFLAVGLGPGGPAAWRSADGRTWVESPVVADAAGDGDALWGITSTRRGYYAWGFDRGRARLWRSADGTAWRPVGAESVFDLPRAEAICAVQDVEGGLRATGVVAPRGTREGHEVTWTSKDGEAWELADAAGAAAMWCDPTEELGHWEARNDAGLVRIDPNGDGNVVELVPTTR